MTEGALPDVRSLVRALIAHAACAQEPEVGPTLAAALRMARLSAAAYAPDAVGAAREVLGGGPDGPWRVRVAETSEGHDPVFTRTVVCESDTETLIAYRGTTSFGPAQAEDSAVSTVRGWVDNLAPVSAGGYRHPAYQVRAAATLADVGATIQAARLRSAAVYLAGHSAGGAIAVLAARELSERTDGVGVDGVFTFGAPMPGTAVLAVEMAGVPIVRVEYGNDPVPWLPGQYADVRTPATTAVLGALAQGITGTVPPTAWCHVGELWYLHRPDAPFPATTAWPGLSIGASKALIEARRTALGRLRDGRHDHAAAVYIGALEGTLRARTGLMPDSWFPVPGRLPGPRRRSGPSGLPGPASAEEW